jgi:hypothetical protein
MRSRKAQIIEGAYDLPGLGYLHAANPLPPPATPSCHTAAAQRPNGSFQSTSPPPAAVRRLTHGVGQQCPVSGRPESGDKLLVAPDHKHSWQEFLQHQRVTKVLAGQKGNGRVLKGSEDLLLALGVLDVGAESTSGSAIAVTPQEQPRQIPAWAAEGNEWVLLRKSISLNDKREANNISACSSMASNTAGALAEVSGIRTI